MTRPFLLLVSSLVLLSSLATAQVTICPGGGWTAGPTHPPGTGSDRLLLVAVGAESNTQGANDIAGVSYGGQALTLADKLETTDPGFSYIGSLWYLNEAGLAAASDTTITVTQTGTLAEFSVAAVTYCNVDQANPIGEVSSTFSLTDPISTSITVDAGNACVAAAGCGNAFQFDWAQDVTERIDINQGSSNWSTADQTNVPTTGSLTAEADFLNLVNRVTLVFAEIEQVPPVSPPPTANFSGSPLSGTEPLIVAFNDLTTGTVTAWSWDFGDGQSSTAQNPSHLYDTAGTYTVALTSSNSFGSDTETKPGFVVVDPAGRATFRNGSGANAPCYVSGPPVLGGSWSAEVDSSVLEGAFLTAILVRPTATAGTNTAFGELLIDITSPIIVNSFRNSSGGSIDAHGFNLPNDVGLIGNLGTSQAIVLGPQNSGRLCNAVDLLPGFAPPVARPDAAFTANNPIGVAPLLVDFTDESLGTVTSWLWNFGDGNTSTERDPSHTYASTGVYEVSLVVEGPGGFDARYVRDFVIVQNFASATYYNGSDANTPCYVTIPPVLGTTWTATVDHRDQPSAGVAIVSLFSQTTPPVNVMGVGEFLVGGMQLLNFVSLTDPSGMTTFSFPVPNDLSLMATGASQGMLANISGLVSFCNAAEMRLGFMNFPLPPAANFNVAPSIGSAPHMVFATDLTSNQVTSWLWDFGDGTTSTAQNPTHVYANPGVYTISLVASGPGGYDIERKLDVVTVQ